MNPDYSTVGPLLLLLALAIGAILGNSILSSRVSKAFLSGKDDGRFVLKKRRESNPSYDAFLENEFIEAGKREVERDLDEYELKHVDPVYEAELRAEAQRRADLFENKKIESERESWIRNAAEGIRSLWPGSMTKADARKIVRDTGISPIDFKREEEYMGCVLQYLLNKRGQAMTGS